jgi:hypothetical protein
MFENSPPSPTPPPPPPSGSPVGKVWRYTSWLLIAVALYVGWIFYSRWNENRQFNEKREEKQKAADLEAARKTVDTLGGNSFDILSFYANPGEVRRGEESQVCYGVSNAKRVALDPPVTSVWPSVSRCFEVTPQKTTTYTLTADDGHGNKKTASFEIKVR